MFIVKCFSKFSLVMIESRWIMKEYINQSLSLMVVYLFFEGSQIAPTSTTISAASISTGFLVLIIREVDHSNFDYHRIFDYWEGVIEGHKWNISFVQTVKTKLFVD